MIRVSMVLAVAAMLAGDHLSAAGAAAVTRYVLPSGMRVLVREDATAGIVAVSLQVRAGAGLESTDAAGVTNFMQRVMVRGAGRWTAASLAEAAERIGGGIEGSADADYAEVRATALARHWDRLLHLVADVALSPTFPPAEIETERRLIEAQLRTRADTPFPVAFDALMLELYGAHPYAVPALGRREVVARLTREDLRAHYGATYRPDGMVLAVSGRVEGGPVLRTVRRLFERQASAAPVTPPPTSTASATARRRVLERSAEQAQLLVGYLAPGLGNPDYPAMKVLGTVLGGGMAGRLFVELRENRGLAYVASTFYPMRIGPAYVAAYLGTARDNLPEAEAALSQQLRRMRSEGPSDAEVDRARAYLLGHLALDRRTNARQAWYLAFFELSGLGVDFPERYAQALRAVTAAQVKEAAQRYLVGPTTVVLAPR
jgi:predicted Zn-dependent peptidase